MPITHSTVVVVADDGTSPVGTDEWNAAHDISGLIKSTEQDFGSTNAYYGSWVITDSDVAAASNIRAYLSAEAPTGRDGDEAEMEPMDCWPENIASGSFTLVAEVRDGPVDGLYKFNYIIG